MRPARTLSPAAAPLGFLEVVRAGLRAASANDVLAEASSELKSYLGVGDLFFLSSGKAALTVTLRALASIDRRRAVAIPAYTCFTVPAAIVRAGLEPVLIDVDPTTMDFDGASLARAMDRSDLLAIVPTHLFGIPSDVDGVRRLAAPRNIFIVEDAAQGLGVVNGAGRRLGSLGDVSIFSLARGKHVTIGSGGIVATSSLRIADALKTAIIDLPEVGVSANAKAWIDLAAMSVLINPNLYWFPAGLPFLRLGETTYDTQFAIGRLSSIASAALAGWRARLETANRAREQSVEAWRRELGSVIPDVCRGALLRLPVLLPSAAARAALVGASRTAGLGVSTMYPSAVHQIPELAAQLRGRYPGAEALAERLVTLPTHRFVRDEDRRAIRALWPPSLPVGSSVYREAASC